MDYAGAWDVVRGRCHGLVYDADGKPVGCPKPATASGWRSDYRGRWYSVDACARHADRLSTRPGRAITPTSP
ncbi:MAG: hypothetical protein M0005_01530 [Actinomycetota bacterium]|nr:hypothetical protein [Actinomycetota bacterium]